MADWPEFVVDLLFVLFRKVVCKAGEQSILDEPGKLLLFVWFGFGFGFWFGLLWGGKRGYRLLSCLTPTGLKKNCELLKLWCEGKWAKGFSNISGLWMVWLMLLCGDYIYPNVAKFTGFEVELFEISRAFFFDKFWWFTAGWAAGRCWGIKRCMPTARGVPPDPDELSMDSSSLPVSY